MNINKLREKSLNELSDLKRSIQSMCDEYGKTLTTYATMSADPMFQKMTDDMKETFSRRNKYMELISNINNIIEEKIDKIYEGK